MLLLFALLCLLLPFIDFLFALFLFALLTCFFCSICVLACLTKFAELVLSTQHDIILTPSTKHTPTAPDNPSSHLDIRYNKSTSAPSSASSSLHYATETRHKFNVFLLLMHLPNKLKPLKNTKEVFLVHFIAHVCTKIQREGNAQNLLKTPFAKAKPRRLVKNFCRAL